MRSSDGMSKKLDINTSLITASQSRKSIARPEGDQPLKRKATQRESASLNVSIRDTAVSSTI